MENLFFTCTWFSVRHQTINSYTQDILVKLRRIAVLVVDVVVILFRRHASDKFQEAISWSRTCRFFLHCLSLKYVVTDHFWWSNVPVDQNKLKSSSFWSNSHMASMFETLFSLYIYVHPAKQWVKSFFHTTDHLQQFRADKFSTFFKSKLSLDVLVG